MPARSLRVPCDWFLDQNAKHSQIEAALPGLNPALQKALAELLLIRLFDDLQEALAGMAYRLACGAPYVDNTRPTLLTAPARSTLGARVMFETHNRAGKKYYVKWSKTTYIKDTVRHVIDPADSFVLACDAHALTISEMQVVRNRIAHRNATTRARFNTVLQRYYGGTPSNVTPGLLLIAPRTAPATPLSRYLAATRVLVKDCARAQ
jgi:hypothetical protein